MNDSNPSPGDAAPLSHDETMEALFASMVMQQANMAMLYLGQMPHPETGQPLRDLEAARMFIDQLEMLEVKTRGNLTKDEAALLKQSLTAARMAFVHAVESEKKEKPAQTPADSGTPAQKTETAGAAQDSTSGQQPGTDEERKKFVKKY
jgi:hypothetical protein